VRASPRTDVQGFFLKFYDPTIEDCYRCQRAIDDEVVLMQVLDTAGQDNFSMMRDSWMRHSDCFLLVFSVTDRRTFEELDEYYQQLLRVKDVVEGKVPVVVIANKVDMVEERQVTEDEALEKCMGMRVPLVEASAKDGLGVHESFEQAVRQHRKFKALEAGEKAGEARSGVRRFKAFGCSVL